MATGHILPGYGTPVTRLKRAQTAYPLDKSKLREIAERNVGTLDRRTLDSIRDNARNMWLAPNYAPTTYNATHNYLQLDEPTAPRPSSPSRRHKPHPKPVFLINRLHYVPGYQNPDATVGKDTFRIDDTFAEEERQLRRHQREKYIARPSTAAVDQYREPWAPLTDAVGPTEAWGAQAWLKTADDDHQHEVVNAIQNYRDQELFNMSKELYGQTHEYENMNNVHPDPEVIAYLIKKARKMHNKETDNVEETNADNKESDQDGIDDTPNKTVVQGKEKPVNNSDTDYKNEDMNIAAEIERKGITHARVESNPVRQNDKIDNQLVQQEHKIQDHVKAKVEKSMKKYEQETSDMAKSVDEKWKAWRETYDQSVEKEIKETTWKNKVTGVRRDVRQQSSSMGKYTHKIKSAESAKDEKNPSAYNSSDSQNAQKESGQKKTTGNGGKTLQINIKDVRISSKQENKRNTTINTNNFTNERQAVESKMQKNKSINAAIRQRPKSAISSRPNSRKSVIPHQEKTTEMVKTLQQQNPQDSFFDIDKMKSETEIMRQIIDQYIVQNCDNAEWLHWIYDESQLTQSPLPPQVDASPRPHSTIPSNHRWMKQAGVRESESVRRILYGGYPPSTIQPLGSYGHPPTLLQRKQQEVEAVRRSRYIHKPTRGDFLIHPEWPPTFLHHRID